MNDVWLSIPKASSLVWGCNIVFVEFVVIAVRLKETWGNMAVTLYGNIL